MIYLYIYIQKTHLHSKKKKFKQTPKQNKKALIFASYTIDKEQLFQYKDSF